MARVPWYDEQPERAAWELAQLEDEGLAVQNEDRRNGALIIRTALEHRGEQLPITITFPCEFPEAAPSIATNALVLDRHQDRGGLHFCLLENPDADWRPGRSARELVMLLKQLLRDDEAGAEAVAEGEADMPEPVSAYYRYGRGIVLVPEQFLVAELERDHGHATLAGNRSEMSLFLHRAEGFEDPSRELEARFVGKGTMPATWLAVDKPPDPADVDVAVGSLMADRVPALLRQMRKRVKSSGRNRRARQLLGVTFVEEGPAVGEQRRTWVFFDVTVSSATATPTVERTMQAQALSLAERQRRLPELEGLSELRALVIGAGSLGGQIAVELAKAGFGGIDIVDHDIYDVNNAVRHVLGSGFAGLPKAAGVAHRCTDMNPFGSYAGHAVMVGSSADMGEALEKLVAEADVVVETTGAQTVTRVVQRHTRSARKTLVVAGLTAGSYGGELIVIRPAGGCFDCFVHAQDDGTIPQPPAGPAHRVTPIGCRHPAFAGAGFDATSLAADAARTVVRATGHVAYPPLDYDWAVINFRSARRWQQGGLLIHTRCHRGHG